MPRNRPILRNETDYAAKLAKGGQIDIGLDMPTPHAKQKEVMASKAPRKVIVAGRRGGKTTFAAMLAVVYLILGKRVLIVSTSAEQASAFWTIIKLWLKPLIEVGLVYKNDTTNLLVYNLPNGKTGTIKARTGRDPDVLRGGYADLLILDECAYLDEDAWREVGAPMLADTDGTAIFISTPAKKNWFYRLYQKGKDTQEPDWMSWHFTSMDNPHLKPKALKRLTSDMSEESYRQEILAEFLESMASVFGNIESTLSLPLISNKKAGVYAAAKPYDGRFVAGVDWGEANDFTVVAVLDVYNNNMVHIERFNHLPWVVIQERVGNILRAWNVERAVVEINSIGKQPFQVLRANKLPVIPFTMTRDSKPMVIQDLQLAFERSLIHMPNHPVIANEFEVFERTVTKSHHTQYSAPPDSHDDIVIASALAYHAKLNGNMRTDVW